MCILCHVQIFCVMIRLLTKSIHINSKARLYLSQVGKLNTKFHLTRLSSFGDEICEEKTYGQIRMPIVISLHVHFA
jgi:hypothetical protein